MVAHSVCRVADLALIRPLDEKDEDGNSYQAAGMERVCSWSLLPPGPVFEATAVLKFGFLSHQPRG